MRSVQMEKQVCNDEQLPQQKDKIDDDCLIKKRYNGTREEKLRIKEQITSKFCLQGTYVDPYTFPGVCVREIFNLVGQKIKKLGTGFLISDNLVLTCGHLFKTNRGLFYFGDQKVEEIYCCYQGTDDIAVLKLYTHKGQTRQHLNICEEPIEQGELVFSYRFYERQRLEKKTGFVTEIQQSSFFSNIPTVFGHSGSPMLNWRGQVVGFARRIRFLDASFLFESEALTKDSMNKVKKIIHKQQKRKMKNATKINSIIEEEF